MTVTLTWQSIITAGAVVTALGVIIGVIFKIVRWVDKQKKQDDDLNDLRTLHTHDMEELKKIQEEQTANIQNELTIICYGLRGALQGLIENGCNGPCKEALNKLDKHLNKEAHDKKS